MAEKVPNPVPAVMMVRGTSKLDERITKLEEEGAEVK